MSASRAGRPPKIVDINQKKMGKEKQEIRRKKEEENRLLREELEQVPGWLSADAKVEYIRVINNTKKIPLLDNLDKGYLAIYADNYARYVEASRELLRNGEVDADGRISPYLNVLIKAAKEMKDASRLMGLATTDRLRLTIPRDTDTKEENKYLKYLKG